MKIQKMLLDVFARQLSVFISSYLLWFYVSLKDSKAGSFKNGQCFDDIFNSSSNASIHPTTLDLKQ